MREQIVVDGQSVLLKPWGQYLRTRCGCAANSPGGHVGVCLACADAHAKHTPTCPPTCGRRRRPTCTGILPLQFEKPWTGSLPQRTVRDALLRCYVPDKFVIHFPSYLLVF